jgi:hypothetical protein
MSTELQRAREYEKDKYDNDLEFKLIKRYKSRIDNYYQSTAYGAYRAEDLLGCSRVFFASWIKFNLPANTDYSTIHLAHVKPITTYKKTKVTDAFHWTNVTPLTAEQNLRQANNRDIELEKRQRKLVTKFLKTVYLS